MTALHLGPRGPIGPLANGGFEVSYVLDDGAEHRVPITQAAWAVPLEHGSPVRRFTSRKGQRHLSGPETGRRHDVHRHVEQRPDPERHVGVAAERDRAAAPRTSVELSAYRR